ncbi:RGCVC family protein [Actinophytocola sp.]|uniref:RGCVC family protein n=1 Tax=Actinophytocola sp. TaxID=1872138 RepID=UPI002ED2C062
MTDTYPNTSGPGPAGQAVATCSACAHPWGAHDQIAARFCAATTVGHHERGCVCDVPPVVETGVKAGSGTG